MRSISFLDLRAYLVKSVTSLATKNSVQLEGKKHEVNLNNPLNMFDAIKLLLNINDYEILIYICGACANIDMDIRTQDLK